MWANLNRNSDLGTSDWHWRLGMIDRNSGIICISLIEFNLKPLLSGEWELVVVLWKALKECEELTKKYSNMTTKNEQLSEECHRYMEEFKRMEEIIKNLKREIAERNRQVDVTHCQLWQFFGHCLSLRPKSKNFNLGLFSLNSYLNC